MTDSQGTYGHGYTAPGYVGSGYPDSGYGSSGYAGYAGPGFGSVGHVVPPAAAVRPADGAPRSTGRNTPVLVAAAGAAVLVVGAAVAAAVAGLILSSHADDVGREIGAELGRAQGQQMDRMMDDLLSTAPYAMDPYAMDPSWSGGALSPSGPVEQFPPVEPGELGPDRVLDGYAADCFAGELQACDDLWYESPPLSAYEEYASTCGGRVKLWSVPVCTDLE